MRLAVLFFVVLVAGEAAAHSLAPAVLELREEADGRCELRFLGGPAAVEAGGAAQAPGSPRVALSLPCHEGARVGGGRRFDCGPGGLAGVTMTVTGLVPWRDEVLCRIHRRDGSDRTVVLRADAPSVVLDGADAGALWSFVPAGVRHILTGADHLLFLTALVLLQPAGGAAALLGLLSAFTLAHSLTLSLAALGVLQVAAAPVEVAIALSVLYLAVLLAARGGDRSGPPAGAPVGATAAFACGLLHGLGFAGALGELAVPRRQLLRALVGFNLGVECGQVLFVGLLLLLRLGWRRLPWRPAVLPRLAVYALGSAAAFWLWQRLAAL